MSKVIHCIKTVLFIFIFIFYIFPVKSQNLPDTARSGKYSFTKQWVNQFDQKENGWNLANWTFPTNLCEFRSDNAEFKNGKMNLMLSKKGRSKGNHPDKKYWGAEYFSSEKYQYGKYVVSMKPDSPPGVISSFFLIRIDGDPANPRDWYEIDIEFAGSTKKVQFALHWVNEQGRKKSTEKMVDLDFDAGKAYHQWVIEWTPDFIRFYVDGKQLHAFTDKKLVQQQANSQSIRMNYWISNAESWAGSFNPSRLPVTTSYDYIAYYSLDW